jgi:3-hydroxymyristoyl/3-hydroxydecanoyl-(acyl carrier protein) dehydratase
LKQIRNVTKWFSLTRSFTWTRFSILIVGYRDITCDEFWVHKYFPRIPIMPQFLLCEAAAQLIGFYSKKRGLAENNLIVLSGMDKIRFHGQVSLGGRIWLVGKATQIGRRKSTFAVQGVCGDKLVFEGEMFGMHISPSG